MLKLFQKNKKTAAQPIVQQPIAAAQTPIYTAKTRVACDGPSFSGHPRIYLEIGPSGVVVCPYCSATFVYDSTHQ